MFLEKVEVVTNRVVAEGCYRMVVASERIAGAAQPGQFVHVRCGDSFEPLLRRPFAVHSRASSESFSLLYKVVGRGSAWLSELKAAQKLDVLGPLGQGFKIFPRDERTVLVAGGIGVAPLLFLAEELTKGRKKVLLLLGAATKESLVAASDFKSLGVEVKTATEDGSAGTKGLVSDLFESALVSGEKLAGTSVYACGPVAMMGRVSTVSLIYDVSCQVSLEERIACGVGACLGCAVATKEGYKRVCADGPVFDGGVVEWSSAVE